MAIATYADYDTDLRNPEILNFSKTTIGRFAGAHTFNIAASPPAAGIPSTAVSCNNTTTGAFNIESQVGSQAGVEWTLARASVNTSAGQPLLLICDRLCHQGGLSATVTGAQTTNLPTAALTRYTSGVGVMICVDIYTLIGTTATTLRATYTNSNGVGGRTTKDVVFGGAGNNAAHSRIWLPLQDGDNGARSVESINVVASTGTAGNFGVTLVKPLTYLMPPVAGTEHFGTNIFNNLIGGCGQFESYLPECCIELAIFAAQALYVTGTLGFIRK